MKISKQVEEIENKLKSLDIILGEVLATLEINIKRGCILFPDEEDSEQFNGFLARWKERYKQVCGDEK